MITEDYCSFEVSKLLKEKGFHELCHYNYHCGGFFYQHKEKDYNGKNYEKLDSEQYSAPTHQIALKWLRNKNIHIEIRYVDNHYKYYINNLIADKENHKTYCGGTHYQQPSNISDTYEKSVEDAIKYCLTNLI